jgi:hypothetical protein
MLLGLHSSFENFHDFNKCCGTITPVYSKSSSSGGGGSGTTTAAAAASLLQLGKNNRHL